MAANDTLSDEDISYIKEKFTAKNGGKPLSKGQFNELTVALLSETDEKKKPSKKDLDTAFDVADEDKNNSIDEGEFINLYRLVKKGQVFGLGGGRKSIFSFSSKPDKKQMEIFKNELGKNLPARYSVGAADGEAAGGRGRGKTIDGNGNFANPPPGLQARLTGAPQQQVIPGGPQPPPPPPGLSAATMYPEQGGYAGAITTLTASSLAALEEKLEKAEAALVEKNEIIATMRTTMEEHEARLLALEHHNYGNFDVQQAIADAAARIASDNNGYSSTTAVVSATPPPIVTAPRGGRPNGSPRRSPAVADRQRRERERRRPPGRRNDAPRAFP